MAMGGAGVAVGNTATAPFFNPALLSITPDNQDFALDVPVALRAYDPDDFIESFDDFQDDPKIFNTPGDIGDGFVLDERLKSLPTIDKFSTPDQILKYLDTADKAVDDLAYLSGPSGLGALGGKAIQAELGTGIVLGVPGKTLGFAFSTSGQLVLGGQIDYKDEAMLNALTSDMDKYLGCLNQTATNPSNPCDPTTLSFQTGYIDPTTGRIDFDPSTELGSSLDLRAAAIGEAGITLSHEFDVAGNKFAVGITPKAVTVVTFDYSEEVGNEEADTDNFDGDEYRKDYTDFNLDLGLAKRFDNGWSAGFVVKNLISREYETVRGNLIEIKPQPRLGVAHQTSWSTVALDLDLVENDPIGYGEGSQYAAFGVELNAFDILQLRGGYRANLVNSERNIASVGVGLWLLGLHVDLAVAGNENELGASAQLGLSF